MRSLEECTQAITKLVEAIYQRQPDRSHESLLRDCRRLLELIKERHQTWEEQKENASKRPLPKSANLLVKELSSVTNMLEESSREIGQVFKNMPKNRKNK